MKEENKKLDFFSSCDRWRVNNPEGEKNWHKMIDSSVKISKETFLKNTDTSNLLDDDETIEEFLACDDYAFFRSSFNGVTTLYAQASGFELIFTKEGKSPEELIKENPLNKNNEISNQL